MAQKYAKIETEENETWLQKLPLGTTEPANKKSFQHSICTESIN